MKTGKGITKCTLSTHRFDGYNLRRQRHGWNFQAYVPASTRVYPGIPVNTRFKRAEKIAEEMKRTLDGIIHNPKAWGDADATGLQLGIIYRRELEKAGFTISRL